MLVSTFTTYDWYLAFHIFAAAIWVGGNFLTQFYGLRARRSTSQEHLVGFTQDVEWVGTRVLVPTSLILLVLGFLLVHERQWEWHFWLVAALAVWAASFVTGAAFLGPESGRLAKVIDERGVDSPEARARISRIFLVSRIELLFLILVVFDMVLKPGA